MRIKNINIFIWLFILGLTVSSFSTPIVAEENLDETLDNIKGFFSNTILERIRDQAGDSQKSLKEKFADAKKRYQPYLNLANQVYSLDELLSPDIFKEYKKLELKSLYLRTDKVNLDAEFASQINKLVKTGIKELLIFFHEDQSIITTEQFNRFIEENEIYINLKMVPIGARDIEKIHADSVGKKDMLGFIGILDYKIIYKDGLGLGLLNNKKTDELILHNYAEHIKKNAERNSFVLKDPEYVTDGDPEAEKRAKTSVYDKKYRGVFHLEITKNIEIDKQKVQQLENEEELDLDLEQAEHKFNREEAIEMAEKLHRQFFYEEFQEGERRMYLDVRSLINSFFNSASDMEFITEKALGMVIRNYGLFLDGIDIENLPLGFAYKKHILFASDQRLASMPVNEFTIKLNPIQPQISNPLRYSWLPFAAKAFVSLNDIYDSDILTKSYGFDEHCNIKGLKDPDIMLDIPHNFYSMLCRFDDKKSVMFCPNIRIKEYFVTNMQTGKQLFLDKFPGIYFYNLDPSYKNRLDEIYDNLQQRGLGTIFNKIIVGKDRYNITGVDGGFLLEEEAGLFLKKIFQEMLPISDKKKQKFFRDVLEGYKFKNNNYLEDVFEGLDGFYKELNELMIKNGIADDIKEKILEKSVAIIKTQMEHGNSFKIILGRFINILRLVLSRGGSIQEQLEYLDSQDGSGILKDSQQYWKAKKLGLSIIHRSLVLSAEKEPAANNKENLSPDILIGQISGADYTQNWYTSYDQQLTNVFRWLATLPAHQKASIETYAGYLYESNGYGHISQGCFSYPRGYYWGQKLDHDQKESLKVREYILFDEVPHRYGIKYDNTISLMQWGIIYRSSTVLPPFQIEERLGKEYALFVIEDKEPYFEIKTHGILKKIKFSNLAEVSKERIESMLSVIKQYTKNENEIYQITEEQVPFQDYPDIFSPISEKIMSDPSIKEAANNSDRDRKEEVRSALYIKPDSDSYDLYLHVEMDQGSDIKLDKQVLILPAVLDERVKQCKSDSNCSYITLMPSEIKGTIFESFAEPFVHQSWFRSKSYQEKCWRWIEFNRTFCRRSLKSGSGND